MVQNWRRAAQVGSFSRSASEVFSSFLSLLTILMNQIEPLKFTTFQTLLMNSQQLYRGIRGLFGKFLGHTLSLVFFWQAVPLTDP